MAKAGSVVVNLIANTGQFTKKMALSKKTMRSIDRAASNIAKRMTQLGVAATAAAVGGLVILTKNSMKSIDVVAKLSDRIGVSTEFLSAFGHAASIAGTSQEEFNKAIEMYVRRLGESKMGTGEAKDALEALDITLDSIINQSPEKSFMIIAERIKGLGTQAEKSAVAYKLFGRTGSKMLNLLESDLSGVIDRAKELGITFDREMAAKVEAANDAITDLNASLSGLGNTLAIEFADDIERFADTLTRLFTGSSYELETFKASLYETMAALYEFMDKVTNLDELFVGQSGWTYATEAAKALEKSAKAIEKAEKLAQKAVDDFVPRTRTRGDGVKQGQQYGYVTEGFVGPPEPPKPEIYSFTASAREIDTSMVSVTGLAMNGEDKTIERQMASSLKSIERTNRKIANQEVLN